MIIRSWKRRGIIITVDNLIKMKKIMEFILYWKKPVYDNIGEYVKKEEYLDIFFNGIGQL